jgi:hypothetical protein
VKRYAHHLADMIHGSGISGQELYKFFEDAEVPRYVVEVALSELPPASAAPVMDGLVDSIIRTGPRHGDVPPGAPTIADSRDAWERLLSRWANPGRPAGEDEEDGSCTAWDFITSADTEEQERDTHLLNCVLVNEHTTRGTLLRMVEVFSTRHDPQGEMLRSCARNIAANPRAPGTLREMARKHTQNLYR